jgi:hypothetical protein
MHRSGLGTPMEATVHDDFVINVAARSGLSVGCPGSSDVLGPVA